MHLRTHTKPESVGQSGRWQSEYHDTMIDHDKNVGTGVARPWRSDRRAIRRSSNFCRRETREGLQASGRTRRCITSPSGSCLHRATALRLATAMWRIVWALARAGSLPPPLWGYCRYPALCEPFLTFAAIAARRSRALTRNDDEAHSFVAYRDDRPGECQPVTFEGDAWRGYIPLRLPWTMCIRDRIPPGSAAVLINPTHTYPDLALPITAAQERVFAAIDGTRSADEVLRCAGRPFSDEEGCSFIKRVWDYYQIVFDIFSLKRRRH
jgi:hypothetical protein